METRVNKKYGPTIVYGDTVIHATVDELNLAIDSMLDKKKIKSLVTTENEIDIAFKTNWWGMVSTVENVCSNLQLIIEPIDTGNLNLLYAFRLRNAKISKIYGIIAASLFGLLGLFSLVAVVGTGEASLVVLPIVFLAFAGVMLLLAFFAWSAKRQLKLFNKIFIQRLEKMLAIVQGNE